MACRLAPSSKMHFPVTEAGYSQSVTLGETAMNFEIHYFQKSKATHPSPASHRAPDCSDSII